MLNIENYTTKKIHVGETITNIPLASQVINHNGRDKYLLLDEATLYIFDINNEELEDSINLSKCGNLNMYSGFNYINSDTIIVYNYKEMILFLLNDKGQVLDTQKIPRNHNRLEWVSSVNALNHSRIGFCNSSISLSGGILGTISESGIRDIPVSERMNMQNKEWETTLTYPMDYSDNNFGSVYLNKIYTASDNNNYFLYGFPIETQIYRFNSNFTICDTMHVQSRYDKGMTTCMNKQEEIEDNESLEIQYFVSQLSYSDILYDPYRHLYIRAVNHPIENWKCNQHFIQPHSFIIVNENGEVLSESRRLMDCADLDFGNMHICSEGLLIAQTCEDEKYIQFRCYNIRNK